MLRRLTLGRMSPEVILGIKNLILNRAKNGELDILKISWFGGEPLIAKHLIYDLSDFIKNTVSTYNIEYYGTMTTNALLTPSVMQTLSDFGITSFQVSLDGIKADHDKTRVRIDGKGTFDKIWQNLIDLSKTNLDFEIVLRVHVHIDNYDNIRQLLNLIAKNFSGDKRFQVFYQRYLWLARGRRPSQTFGRQTRFL